MKRLDDVLLRLDALIDWERSARTAALRQELAPMRDLMQRLGHPERAFRCVHVAGSKGKGSTAALIAAGLSRAGFGVGTYGSPHVDRVHERIRLAGRDVDDDALAAALEPALEARAAAVAEGSPAHEASWFDLVTAAGFQAFRTARVDWAVVEVGLGGRLDSTNVLQPEVCVVTGIELEHTQLLGSTRAAIAGEKAGILKPGATLVSGLVPDAGRGVQEDAGRVIVERAAALGLELCFAPSASARPPLPPSQRNLSVARTALDALGRRGVVTRAGEALSGELLDAETVAAARLPARLERILGQRVPMVLDGAHAPEALEAVLGELALDPALGGPCVAVVSLAKDKDAPAFLKALGRRVDRVLCTSAVPDRHHRPEELAALASAAALPAEAVPSVELAIARALEQVPPAGWVLVTGSLWLAGEARRVL